jgi:acyl-CoA thioesterase
VDARQNGAPVLTAQTVFGAPGESPGHPGEGRPATVHPEKLAPLGLPPAMVPHFTGLVDYRPAGGGFPLAGGDEARVRLWMRLTDRRPLDAARLCFLLDAVFPAFYAVLTRPAPAVTVDLRYDFLRAITPDVAPDGWALFDFSTRHFADGWAVEDGVAWSRAGEMLAVARQLRKVLAKGASRA